MERPGTAYCLEVNPKIPKRLERLVDLAHDLWYSWDRTTRQLFARLDSGLWNSVGHSPKLLLKRIDERRLREAADDPGYLHSYHRVLSAYDTYLGEVGPPKSSASLGEDDLVAYFCAEFGFHESLPIYSGGLGILAGDHCKAASDVRLPFVAVGLLYRQGYFHQTIDQDGYQLAAYEDSEFDDMPVSIVAGADGAELRLQVPFPGRTVEARIWQVRVGHVRLYLLDTDIAENQERDRRITHRLYGGDREVRIAQELVLGVGGVRALAALGMKPTVWHINEGHAAFQVIERVLQLKAAGLDFDSALEAVAANTVFTTHTAVAAGHDRFAEDMIGPYLDHHCRELGVGREVLLALGRTPSGHEFNMTALAVRGSRYQNGVSRIHGEVSADMLRELWPQVSPQENPVTHVTNAVHVPTFLSPDWANVFERFLGFGWLERWNDPSVWSRIDEIPDYILWSRHQFLKTQMLHLVRYRVSKQHFRNRGSEAHLDRMLKYADPSNPNVLTIGFARRFATYKRATLLFQDIDWLRRLVSEADRPVLILVAGKAHPADEPGQELIRQVTRFSQMPEFEGHVLLVEDYDLRLARRLVSGVDVWLNTPIYPLEASGTSGMKAGMNGVVNLSVLDGWWEEGYRGNNGWAIKPASNAYDQNRRNREEAHTLYEILQDQVIPLYYRRGELGYSPQWLQLMKQAIASILPNFGTNRMMGEYITKLYTPAAAQWRRYLENSYENAKSLAAWKKRVVALWPSVKAHRLDAPPRRLDFGERMRVEIAVDLHGLHAEDVAAEVVMTGIGPSQDTSHRHPLQHAGMLETGEHRFAADVQPDSCGRLDYRIRVYPRHALLSHPFETGLMIWI